MNETYNPGTMAEPASRAAESCKEFGIGGTGAIRVATMAGGGGHDTGLLAVRSLGAHDDALRKQGVRFQTRLATESRSKNQKRQTVSGIVGPR